MKLTILIIISLLAIAITQDISPEVKRNVLRFPYGVLFKYIGQLTTNIERVWVVNKIELPKITDVNLESIKSNFTSKYLSPKSKKFCISLMSVLKHYEQKHPFYNHSIHQLLEKEIPLILPKFQNQHRYKRM